MCNKDNFGNIKKKTKLKNVSVHLLRMCFFNSPTHQKQTKEPIVQHILNVQTYFT